MKKKLQRGRTGLVRWFARPALRRSCGRAGLAMSLGVCAMVLASAGPAAAQPINDNFIDAEILFGPSETLGVGGSTLGATHEADEPPHYGEGSASIWYRWTAPNTGVFTFDTIGSDFDTVLAVYRGTELTNLLKVAANDDLDPDSFVSRVTFRAVAGVEYSIAIDGYQTQTGNTVLRWFPGDVDPTPALGTGVFVFATDTFLVTEFETQGSPYAPGNPSLLGRTPPGAVVTVTRLGGSTGRVSVDYETVPGGGTGVVDIDYVDTRGTLHFDDFQTSARFIVPVLTDLTSNDTKTVVVA